MALAEYLQQFEEPPGYLNSASFGPPSRAVVRALASTAQAAAVGTPGLHDHDERALAAVARVTGFPQEACLLTTSTSAGLQQIAFGLPGAEVLVGRDEFPSNLYPWWRAQEAGLLKVREISGTEGLLSMTPETIAAAITPSTSVIAVSAVDFRTGYRADLPGIREVIGDRLLIVDGIQGFGVVDQQWTFADALVVGGQKWLRAGWGTGFTALSPRALERLQPTLGGWTGVEQPTRYDGQAHALRAGAQRLSVTNLSPFTSAALWTALELIESVGIGELARQVRIGASDLIAELDEVGIPVLSPRSPRERAGIVVAEVPLGRAAEIRDRLAEQGLTVTAHAPDRIRLSVHATTSMASMEQVAAALRAWRTSAPAR
jgi:selenocysteine lyase/cysteine desulfurase